MKVIDFSNYDSVCLYYADLLGRFFCFKKCRILINFSFLPSKHYCCFFCFFCSQIYHRPICSCNPFIPNKNRSTWKKCFWSIWFRTYKIICFLKNTFMIIFFTFYKSLFQCFRIFIKVMSSSCHICKWNLTTLCKYSYSFSNISCQCGIIKS